MSLKKVHDEQPKIFEFSKEIIENVSNGELNKKYTADEVISSMENLAYNFSILKTKKSLKIEKPSNIMNFTEKYPGFKIQDRICFSFEDFNKCLMNNLIGNPIFSDLIK